jgi:hypothetical protein
MRRSTSFKRSRTGSISSSQATQLDPAPLRRRQSSLARRASASKANLKQVVMQVLDRQREQKEATGGATLFPGVLQSGSVSAAGNIITVSPSSLASSLVVIPQGTDNGQRIGNRVTTKKLIHVLSLVWAPQNAVSNPNPIPYIIRVYWFKRKGQTTTLPGLPQLTTTATADFFELGNAAGSAGFTGDIIDYGKYLSQDDYIYCTHRDYKVGAGNNAQQPNTSYANFSNNDYHFTVVDRVDLTKFCPKSIVYDDADNVNVSSIFCVCQLVAASGEAVSASITPITWKNQVLYKYTDM